jgi:hypothetical protein
MNYIPPPSATFISHNLIFIRPARLVEDATLFGIKRLFGGHGDRVGVAIGNIFQRRTVLESGIDRINIARHHLRPGNMIGSKTFGVGRESSAARHLCSAGEGIGDALRFTTADQVQVGRIGAKRYGQTDYLVAIADPLCQPLRGKGQLPTHPRLTHQV